MSTFGDEQEGVDEFDRAYFERFGRYPAESPLAAVSPSVARRRQAVQRLIEQGATEGERAAARAAFERLSDDAGFADTSPHREDQGFA